MSEDVKVLLILFGMYLISIPISYFISRKEIRYSKRTPNKFDVIIVFAPIYNIAVPLMFLIGEREERAEKKFSERFFGIK